MFKSTILKLRQEESVPTANNGSWTTTLSKPVVIEEGDQIQIKSAFIDTSQQSNVSVDQDFTAYITTAKYLTNYYLAADAGSNNPFRFSTYTHTDDSAQGPDNQKYWACERLPGNDHNRLLESILIFPIRERKFGDLPFQMQVRDPNWPASETGPAPFVTIPWLTVPQLRWKDYKTGGYVFEINTWVRILDLTKPFYENIRLVPFKNEFKGAWAAHNMSVPIMSNAVFNITEQSNSFVGLITDKVEIPFTRGEYSPTELAQIITDKMSLLQQPGREVGDDYPNGVFLVNSPFLTSVFQLYWQALKIPAAGGGYQLPTNSANNSTTLYMREDGEALFSNWGRPTDATEDNLIGCNNASLNFDTNFNKLNFDVLHYPVFVGTSPLVPGIEYTPTVTPASSLFKHQAVTAYAGLGIVEFDPPEFWNLLGFDSKNCIRPNQLTSTLQFTQGSYVSSTSPITLSPLSPATSIVHRITVPSTDGAQTTSQYAGIDLVVNNTGTPAASWNNPYLNTAGVASSITNPIMGNRTFNGSDNNDGFYMVNIGTNLPQRMIASDLPGVVGSNELQSIIGKFYTAGNFLQDQGEGSVAYTHVGPPQMLKSLDINILNGDSSMPINTDLRPNNTIFLEIIKAVQPQVQPNQSK
tara:strand:- start:2321 stop:4237 length:1917 start_codon:yes stop_codon:yes gene_type:complete